MGSCAYIVNIGRNVFPLINWLKEYRIFVEFRILFTQVSDLDFKPFEHTL